MKRSLITTLIIAIAVAIVVGILHATRAIGGFEAGVAHLVSDYAGATRVVGEKWQYIYVLLIAAGVAWLSLRNPRPRDGREIIYCSAFCWLSFLCFPGSAPFTGSFSSRFRAFLQSH